MYVMILSGAPCSSTVVGARLLEDRLACAEFIPPDPRMDTQSTLLRGFVSSIGVQGGDPGGMAHLIHVVEIHRAAVIVQAAILNDQKAGLLRTIVEVGMGFAGGRHEHNVLGPVDPLARGNRIAAFYSHAKRDRHGIVMVGPLHLAGGQ